MIDLYTGKPGSGKSYYAVRSIIEALQNGRRVWALLDIKMSGKWADVAGLTMDDLKVKLLLPDSLNFLNDVGDGDLIVIDESQRWFRAGVESNKEYLLFMETHRHKGCDVVILTQDYQKIQRQVYVLAEQVYKFRKMSLFGLKNYTRISVSAGVSGDDHVKTIWHKFDVSIFTLYRSFDAGADGKKAQTIKYSIWSSWLFRIALVGLIFIAYVIWGRDWVSADNKVKPEAVVSVLNPVVEGATGLLQKRPPAKESEVYDVVAIVCSGGDCIYGLSNGRMVRAEALFNQVGGSYNKGSDGIYRIVSDRVRFLNDLGY